MNTTLPIRATLLVAVLVILCTSVILVKYWHERETVQPDGLARASYAIRTQDGISHAPSLIILDIAARVPHSFLRRQLSSHGRQLESILREADRHGLEDPLVIRQARRKVLRTLDLEGKATSIDISLVPDLSLRTGNSDVQKQLERIPGTLGYLRSP